MSNWTKALLVALRIAIGWHFLYEGLWKIDSDRGSASNTPSWYAVYSATTALRDAHASGAFDPAKADVWYDDVLRGLRARGRSPSEDQKARLAELRDRVKRAAVTARGRISDDQAFDFDWLYVRDEVLQLPPTPASARFSSLSFLQGSAGPLRPLFRGLVHDMDGLERLTPAAAQAALERRYGEILKHYARGERPFTAAQQQGLARYRDTLEAAIARTLTEDPIASRLADYRTMRQRVQATRPEGVAFGRERLDADRAKLDATAGELLALVGEAVEELSAQAQSMASVEQLGAGPLPRAAAPTDGIDFVIRWGLTAIGVCLMLGLFTPVAATAAALQLAVFYLASPPWPNLPASALGGHYLYVDRNLIELVAALAIVGTGRSLGLDAALEKWWRRLWHLSSVERPAVEPAQQPAEKPAGASA